MPVMELAPNKGVEIAPLAPLESPVFKFNTTHHETKAPRDYEFHWFNTVIRLYDYGYDAYAKHFDDGKEEKVLLPGKLREEMLAALFPFSYFPTPAVERNWKQPPSLADSYRLTTTSR